MLKCVRRQVLMTNKGSIDYLVVHELSRKSVSVDEGLGTAGSVVVRELSSPDITIGPPKRCWTKALVLSVLGFEDSTIGKPGGAAALPHVVYEVAD